MIISLPYNNTFCGTRQFPLLHTKAHRAFKKIDYLQNEGRKEMVDFDSLCEKYGIDLGDKKEEFTKELLQNYKTVGELERNKEKLARAESELETYKADVQKLQSQIETFNGTADEVAALKAENEAFKAREAEAVKQAEKDAFDNMIEKQIKEAIGSREFYNSYVEKAFTEDLKNAILNESNKDKTVTELFTEMTNNQDGLFKAEQTYSEHPGISENASSSNNMNRDVADVFADFVSGYLTEN